MDTNPSDDVYPETNNWLLKIFILYCRNPESWKINKQTEIIYTLYKSWNNQLNNI